MSTTAEPSSSTSTASPSKERVEIMSKAVNLMGQGRRNLICGDVPMAVTQFEECCQILAQTYGEMAFECAPAYFSYGHALLELARMDSKVIESLEAEAEEDEEDESEKSEDGKSGGETPGTTEDEDRTDKSESLSSQDEGTDKEAKTEKDENVKDDAADDDKNENVDEHIAGNDVTNLQLAWESLELAKIIYLKRKDKESQLKAAQAFLKLGEVGLETGVYDQAIEDIKECLKIQKEYLEPEEREIAESYYQLGLVHVFAGNHDSSIENFEKAVSVIEARIEKLNKSIEANKDSKETADVEAVYNAKTEIKELEEVVPDIKQKITDTIEEKKTVADLKLMAKKEAEEKLLQTPKPGTSGFEAMGNISGITSLGTTTTGFSSTDAGKSQDVKTTDISHLVRRKTESSDAKANEQTEAKDS
ncbi:NASP [Acanthosepion pharaonis]|uniref:NASP n=1 Tax=Acanthosepion pharaonis TaxID=158019 RepID=A0A812CZH4_ACAPH|nr:NASP [Sepia pharaonis]